MVLPVDNPYFKCVALRDATGDGLGVGSTTDLGLPSTYPCVLFSTWVTVPAGTLPTERQITFQDRGGQVGFNWSMNAGLLAIYLKWDLGGAIGSGQLGISLTPGQIVHVLISVDSTGHKVQCYIDDAPYIVPMGWFNANPMYNLGEHWQLSVLLGGTHEQICAGDTWFTSQATFTDLTVTANRRKFINADLTPVGLGTNGQTPFGTSPPLFLHVPTGGMAADYMTNYGTGGPWVRLATFPTLGFCIPPTPPPPAKLAMDNVVCTAATTRLSENLVSLRWSDDRGHTFGSPVTQSIGEIGEYRTSLQWARLGMSRDRCFELSWSVPMATALQGCWFDATPAQS